MTRPDVGGAAMRLGQVLVAWAHTAEEWLLADRRALYGAAACRMGTGLAVLGLLVTNFSSRHVWVGEGSIWAEPAREVSQFPEMALLDGVSGDVLTMFYVVTMLSALALTLGWHAKAANVVTLIGFIAIVGQNPVVGNENDNLLRITLLWLLLMHTTEYWSLDARRRARERPDHAEESAPKQAFHGDQVLPDWLAAGLHHVGLLGLLTQTLLLFTASGLDKVSQQVWQNGTALYYTAQLPENRPFGWLSDLLTTSTVMLGLVTYAVLLTQLFFAPLLLNRISRRMVIGVTLAVNVVLAVLFAMPWSSLAFIALTALFISSETYERLDEWLRDRFAPAGDWLVLRGYDIQEVAAGVMDRTVYPVLDWVRVTIFRR